MIKNEDPQSSGNNSGSANGPTRESTKSKTKVLIGIVIAIILIASITTCVRNNKADAAVMAQEVSAVANPTN